MIEVLKQALEALENYENQTWEETKESITSLRQAIAELESQEPVATVTSETGADITMSWWHEPALPIGTKLYIRPLQRTWVGLTDVELAEYADMEIGSYDRCLEVEAKLKEKNT